MGNKMHVVILKWNYHILIKFPQTTHATPRHAALLLFGNAKIGYWFDVPGALLCMCHNRKISNALHI